MHTAAVMLLWQVLLLRPSFQQFMSARPILSTPGCSRYKWARNFPPYW
jgi:hypothetical protein